MGGSNSKPLEFETPWRGFDWGQKQVLKKQLENFSVRNPDVSNIRILLAGQIGAGKSSFINSVNSALQGEIAYKAITDTTHFSCGFTQKLTTYQISSERKDLPFVISDIRGLQADALSGLQVEDIISTILGHVVEDYKFKEHNPITAEDEHYNQSPSVAEQTFCLVYVIAADSVHLANERLFDKLKIVRKRVSEKGIPQKIIMTKIDKACPLVKKDLRKVYTSKKIKERMEMCSIKVGVPLCYIFPVKNYHEEIETKEDMDVLILKAFNHIVCSANKRLMKGPLNQ